MNITKQLLTGVILSVAATAANATIVDFKSLLGGSERGEQPLIVDIMTINGYYDNGATKTLEYAYLDENWGGLGVCKELEENVFQIQIL